MKLQTASQNLTLIIKQNKTNLICLPSSRLFIANKHIKASTETTTE